MRSGNGTYVICNKKNKDIVFELKKDKAKITDTYMKTVVKYYLENKMSDFNLNEYKITQRDEKTICFNIDNYDEIDKVINFMYELNKRTMKDLKGYSNVTGYVMLKYGEYIHYPYIGTDKNVEEIIDVVKVDYARSTNQ